MGNPISFAPSPSTTKYETTSEMDTFIKKSVQFYVDRNGYNDEIYTTLWNSSGITHEQVVWGLQFVE